MNDSGFRMIGDGNYSPGITVEKDGVCFGYYARGKEIPVLLLYKKGTEDVAARIPFPNRAAAGGFYSMKVKLSPSRYEYNFSEGDHVFTDPYAKLICGREEFGKIPELSPHSVRGGFPSMKYDWEDDQLPEIPYDEAVMYHLHLRGFTMQKNSGVRKKGTFAGMTEKIGYLKDLGINQVKLMPIYEFPEMIPRHPGQETVLPDKRERTQGKQGADPDNRNESPINLNREEQYKMNYWGYGDGYYFAPKASYSAGNHPVEELKDMVKAFHRQGIEVLTEFSFSEETDICMIERCLNYWAEEYHMDGFSVIARDTVVAELARLPLFRSRKLICTWYPDSVKKYNEEKLHCELAESNDGFMNDCRRMLKGDEQCIADFGKRLRTNPRGCSQINYMTNHDGFTMLDLVSYDWKNNLENGEQNRDGTEYNYSWNCGVEGPSKKKEITTLRLRQRKNAYAMMLFAQGTPMLLAGDEIGNSQNGNNNPYCHDSELTWVDWSRQKSRENRELREFVKNAISYRKNHKMLHQKSELLCSDYLASGFPDLSFHGEKAWFGDLEHHHRYLGCLYSGYYTGEEELIYIAYNFNWSDQEFALPLLSDGQSWHKVMDTSREKSFLEKEEQEVLEKAKYFRVSPRTIVILEGKKHEAAE